MKSSIFWDITKCSPLKVNRRIGGTYRLHLQSRRISQARNDGEASFLVRLFFDTEDGGDMFFRSAGWLSRDYTALYSFSMRDATFWELAWSQLQFRRQIVAITTKQWEFEARWGQEFWLPHVVQTGSGGHPTFRPMGTGGFFPGGKSCRGVKLTTRLQLVPRSRIRGSIHPLPYTSSRRSG
jgi:hypothetical protein